jgi:hypothetical protein
MPLEGQAQRAAAGLTRRDRRFLLGLAGAAAALVAAGGVYASVGGPADDPGVRCTSIVVPSTMGGATLRTCRPSSRPRGPK